MKCLHVQSSQQSTGWWMMLILNPIRIFCLAWPTTPKLGYHLIWILVLPRAQSRPWKTRIVTLDTINTSTRHRLATESLLPCQRQAERIANRIITVSVYSCILDFYESCRDCISDYIDRTTKLSNLKFLVVVNEKNENLYRRISTASLNDICTGFLLLPTKSVCTILYIQKDRRWASRHHRVLKVTKALLRNPMHKLG